MNGVRDAIMTYGPNALRRLNATTTGDLTFEDPEIDLARFDRFPPELRFRIDCNNTKVSCASLQPHAEWAQHKFGNVNRTIGHINQIERNDLEVFAGMYFGRYRTTLPHVAAEATFLRYGALGPSRYPPKEYGRGIYRTPSPGSRRRRKVKHERIDDGAADGRHLGTGQRERTY